MGQQKKHTIAFQSSPLKEYIDRACSSLSPHLHNGGWFLQVGQDREIDQQYMSIPVEIRRVECQLGRIIPCDGAYGQGTFQGLDWREIKGWCPIEWAILGKTFLAKGIVPQEPSDIWDEICTSLHWDPSGRPYEGWIQCLLMALLGSLHDAPCVNTTQR